MSSNIQYSKYSQGIDLEDYSGSFSTNGGAIYLSSSYMNFRSHLDVNSKNIVNLSDPSNAQDAATKAYVDAQVTAQDLDFSTDSGAGSVDLDSQTMAFAGSDGLDVTHSGQTLTFALDVNEVTAETAIADDDAILVYDDSAGAHRKMTRANFIESAALDSINIDGGAIDGTPIGENSAAAGHFTTIEASSTLTVDGALDANSSANIQGAVVMQSTLNGQGAADFDSTLNVDGAATLNGDVTLGDASADTIAVSGAADFRASVAMYDELHAHSTMEVDGIATFGGAIDANSTSDFQGAMNLQDTLTVAGAADLNGALDVAGAVSLAASGVETDIRGTLVVDEAAQFDGAIDANGALDVAGATSLAASGVATDIRGTLSVDEAAQFDSTLGVTGIATFSAAIDANSTSDFQGAMNLQDTLTVAGAIDANSSADFQGAVNMQDTLTVAGAIDANSTADFQSSVNMQSTLTVAGVATFNGNVDLGNETTDSITVTGRFDSDLLPSVDDASDLGSTANEWRNLYLDGTAYIDALEADSAKIGDLTSGRVVLAGTSGELEDNASLTYDGTTLTLASDNDVKARSYITYSDAALKENVETVTNAMDMIQGLRGVSYDLKDGGKREYGFIAQEVNSVVPEVVHTSGDVMGIDYTRITSLLVEAVKTQQAEIEALKNLLDK